VEEIVNDTPISMLKSDEMNSNIFCTYSDKHKKISMLIGKTSFCFNVYLLNVDLQILLRGSFV
jgi:hypothetical protein